MKLNRLFATAALIALFGSCAKEISTPQAESQVTITASFQDENGNEALSDKTTVVDGGTQVYWEPNDEVKLFFDGTGSRLVSTNKAPVAVASFSGTFYGVISFSEGFAESTPLWGLYPYNAAATSDNTSVTTILPDKQIGRAGSFAKDLNIALAKSNTLSMSFYNVCGGLRFSLTRSDINEVIFEGRDGENLAGKVKLGFADGVPAVLEVKEGANSITLSAPSSGCFESGKWYYIVALPGTLSKGFKMTFNTETKYAELTGTTSVKIARGKYGSLTNADQGLTFKDKGSKPVGKYIEFKDNIAKYACLEKFDKDEDGELSYEEAAAVTSISGLFTDFNTVSRFDELKYFTGITSLSSALTDLPYLKSVTIPENVKSIEDVAFQSCSVLDSLSFASDNLSSIGSYAFRYCTKLKYISLPSTVKSIGGEAFYGCQSIESIDVPAGVTVISDLCFSGCSSLEAISLPSGITSIGTYAFYGCSKLASIELPAGVTQIGSHAFEGCRSLKSIILPAGLTEISAGLFKKCTGLYSVSFPAALTKIGDDAFRHCEFIDPNTKTSKIDIPATVTTIGSRALNGAYNVLIHSGSVSIASGTFGEHTKIYVPDARVELYKIKTNWSNYAKQIYELSSSSDKLTLPSPEAVDLGLSVKWANFNVGSSSPEKVGRYFAFGDIKGQTWDGEWSGDGFSTYPSYELDSKNNLKPEYDAAHVLLGGKWRMPTKAELDELIGNCSVTWTSNYNGTGVAGRIFTSKKTGYTDKSIFLPAAGLGYSSDLYNAGSDGNYWSSTFDGGSYAWCLYFNSGNVGTYCNIRRYGFSVRPVSE